MLLLVEFCHSTMTMEELLKSLTKKVRVESEESHRQVVAALNAQAGILVIQAKVRPPPLNQAAVYTRPCFSGVLGSGSSPVSLCDYHGRD